MKLPFLLLLLILVISCCCVSGQFLTTEIRVDTSAVFANMSRTLASATIDMSQIAYNIEFWDNSKFLFRNAVLRNFTSLLRPLVLRIGGTAADFVYYNVTGSLVPSLQQLPHGYTCVMQQSQVDRLLQFANETGAEICFLINGGPGPRGGQRNKAWTTSNAHSLIQYIVNHKLGSLVRTYEFSNEANVNQYASAAQYAADFRVFRMLIQDIYQALKLQMPKVGSPSFAMIAHFPRLPRDPFIIEFFSRTRGLVDIAMFNSYAMVNQSCANSVSNVLTATPQLAVSPLGLRYAINNAQYFQEQLRAANNTQPLQWIDESSLSICGGQHSVDDYYVHVLPYLISLGAMSRINVSLFAHQTMMGANYGFLSWPSFQPRPIYYAAVLFKRLMGTRLLLTNIQNPSFLGLYVYAQCTFNSSGSVTVLLVNSFPLARTVRIATTSKNTAQMYALSAGASRQPLNSSSIALNGRVLPKANATSGTLSSILQPVQLSVQQNGFAVVSLQPFGAAFVVLDEGAAVCK